MGNPPPPPPNNWLLNTWIFDSGISKEMEPAVLYICPIAAKHWFPSDHNGPE